LRSREDLYFDLKLVDNLVGSSFPNTKLDIYLTGGAACILAGYLDRATRDFDFVDRGYVSQLSKVLKLLEPYDLLTSYFAAIPVNYMERAIKIQGFSHISVYLFSREDIIASKIDRLSPKDIEDINVLIADADRGMLEEIIKETQQNIVYDDRKERYANNLKKFREIYNLPERNG